MRRQACGLQAGTCSQPSPHGPHSQPGDPTRRLCQPQSLGDPPPDAEKWPAGAYTVQSSGGDGLPTWTAEVGATTAQNCCSRGLCRARHCRLSGAVGHEGALPQQCSGQLRRIDRALLLVICHPPPAPHFCLADKLQAESNMHPARPLVAMLALICSSRWYSA